MKRLATLLIALFTITLISAQNTGGIWYFPENAGLSWCGSSPFPMNDPEVIFDGQLQTGEGVATISDANCNLLFYTNGVNVWDATHSVMAGSMATSFGGTLKGDISATQSAVIVQKPLDWNIYYIFTVPANYSSEGLRYSKVDMSLNGGLGDVDILEKNQLLYTPTTEKLTTVWHANGLDVWVLSHEWNSNGFVAYLVTSSGVNTSNPVISNVGQVYGSTTSNSRGYLKVSPSGSKLAAAVQGDAFYELYDFNNFTGVVSSPVLLQQPNYVYCYGVEFSMNENYLYGSERYGYVLRQYDLTASNILASEIQIATLGSAAGGALQRAINGKIYLARNSTNYLGCINSPDVGGLGSNYVDQAIYLGDTAGTEVRVSRESLPAMPQPVFFTLAPLDIVTSCTDSITSFNINIPSNFDTAYWNLNYPSTDPQWNVSTTNATFDFHYSTAGLYQVQLITLTAGQLDTSYFEVPVAYMPNVDLGPNQSLCPGDSLVFDFSFNTVNSLSGNCTYQLESEINGVVTVDTMPDFIINQTGVYTFSVYTDTICGFAMDQLIVEDGNVPVAPLPSQLFSCTPDTFVLHAMNEGASYQWSTGDTTQLIQPIGAGTYTVTVSNSCGTTIDSVIIETVELPIIELGADTSICEGESLTLNAFCTGCTYLWSTGEVTEEIIIGTAGVYELTASNICGASEDIISLSILPSPNVSFSADTIIASGSEFQLFPAVTGAVEFLWSTSDTLAVLIVSQPGWYSIEVTSAEGCTSSAEVYIDFLWGLEEQEQVEAKIWVYPNPVNELLNINLLDNSQANYTLLNSTGQLIQQGRFEQANNKLDVRNFSEGLYYLSIMLENGMLVTKPIEILR